MKIQLLETAYLIESGRIQIPTYSSIRWDTNVFYDENVGVISADSYNSSNIKTKSLAFQKLIWTTDRYGDRFLDHSEDIGTICIRFDDNGWSVAVAPANALYFSIGSFIRFETDEETAVDTFNRMVAEAIKRVSLTDSVSFEKSVRRMIPTLAKKYKLGKL